MPTSCRGDPAARGRRDVGVRDPSAPHQDVQPVDRVGLRPTHLGMQAAEALESWVRSGSLFRDLSFASTLMSRSRTSCPTTSSTTPTRRSRTTRRASRSWASPSTSTSTADRWPLRDYPFAGPLPSAYARRGLTTTGRGLGTIAYLLTSKAAGPGSVRLADAVPLRPLTQRGLDEAPNRRFRLPGRLAALVIVTVSPASASPYASAPVTADPAGSGDGTVSGRGWSIREDSGSATLVWRPSEPLAMTDSRPVFAVRGVVVGTLRQRRRNASSLRVPRLRRHPLG